MINSTKDNKVLQNTSIMASTIMQRIMLDNNKIKFDVQNDDQLENSLLLTQKRQKAKIRDDFHLKDTQNSPDSSDKRKFKLNLQYQKCQIPPQKKTNLTSMIKNSKLRPLRQYQTTSRHQIQSNVITSLKKNKIIFDNQSDNERIISMSRIQQQKISLIKLYEQNQKQESPNKVSVNFQLFFPKSKFKTTINHQPRSNTRRTINVSSFYKQLYRVKKSSKSISLNQNSYNNKIIPSLASDKLNEDILISIGKNSSQKYNSKIQKFKKYKNSRMSKQVMFGLNVIPAERHEIKSPNQNKTKQKTSKQVIQMIKQLQITQSNAIIRQQDPKKVIISTTMSQGVGLTLNKKQDSYDSEINISLFQQKLTHQSQQKKSPSQHKLVKKNVFGPYQLQRKKQMFKTKYQENYGQQKGTLKNRLANMSNCLDQLLNAYCCRIETIPKGVDDNLSGNTSLINKKSQKKQESKTVPVLEIYQKIAQKSKQQAIQKQNALNQLILIQSINNSHVILPNPKIKKDKYYYFVGNGNNKNLIRSIMKKRGWWAQTQDINLANFVWTQLKIKDILDKQQKLSDNMTQQPDSWNFKIRDVSNLSNSQKSKSQHNNSQYYQLQLQNYLKIFHRRFQPTYYRKLSQKSKEYQCLRQLRIPQLVHNHYDANYMLGNKKALFYNLTQYGTYKKVDIYGFMPLTFHIEKVSSREFRAFQKAVRKMKNSLWIVKPGENSNRGKGIFVQKSIQKIKAHIQKHSQKHSFIVQKYLQSIFLYNKRKFDIRVYMLMTTIGGITKFFWYQEGYIRTSSQIYDPSDISDLFIHLTNDAIQSKSDTYSKYEKGNKVSYAQLQRYLDSNYPNQNYHVNHLALKMKSVAEVTVKSTYFKLDKAKKTNGFELFGLDFLIDKDFNPWLLEVNTNPCLQLSSTILERLIPRMVQNMFRISLDPLIRPNQNTSKNSSYFLYDNVFDSNKFTLIFDSLFDSDFQWEQICNKQQNIAYQDQDQIFDNNGDELDINV